MPEDLPVSNNDETTDRIQPADQSVEPSVDVVSTDETKPSLETNRDDVDAVMPIDITLTARQERVLRYLARRRMRNARITRRPLLPGEPLEEAIFAKENQPAHFVPSPALESITNGMGAELLSTTPISVPSAEIPVTPAKNAIPTTPLISQDYLSPGQSSPKKIPVSRTGSPFLGRDLATDAESRAMLASRSPAEQVIVGTLSTLLPSTTQASQTQKIWRRRKILRHLSRKHLRKARASEYRAARNRWMTIGSVAFSILIVLLSIVTAGSVAAYQFLQQTQTKYEHQVVTLHDLLPLDNLKMYDSKGLLLMQMTDQGIHTTVSLAQVAPVLVNATVATEDKNFWSNQGIDILRIIRAALDDLHSGHVVEGGSTITQQLIKNLVVGNQPTIVRKLEEVVLTPQINSHYSKRDIMEMYLNSIYYGRQAYGIDAAATVYFDLEDKPGGKHAAMQLDLAQAAMLAGIPSNPSAFDPLAHPRAAFNRFETVLGSMVTQGYIKKVDALDAIKEARSPKFFKTASSLTNRAPHFTNFALSQLVQLFHLKDQRQLSRSGMMVTTTLDLNLQNKIQKIAQRHIAELRDAHNLTNAAEVLIDFHTGAIISLLGSIDYNNKSIDGQFDVATQGYRQPGSSFKPYVYVTAFKQGASPAQAIDDTPTTIDEPGANPPAYSPTNYDLQFHGHMTLRCALQNSLNVPAVRVLRHVGIDAAMQTAYDMGITSYSGTPGYSLVLGGLGVRLIDHTSAMGTFANGGVHIPYYSIDKVVAGNTNKVVYQHQLDAGKRVISPQLAYMMSNVLSDNESRIPEFYDCNVLQLYSNSQNDCYNGNRGVVRPAAAKTGTTQNFRDNWTIGYTTDYVMGVWAGNDDNSPMYQVTGVMGAAPIWHDSMLLAEQGHPIHDFTNPGGLQQATVTYPDGVKTTDWFLPGTVPNFAQPTPGTTPTPQTTATAVSPTPTATPGNGGEAPAPATLHPYCPGSYSFAFNPPAADASGNGWW